MHITTSPVSLSAPTGADSTALIDVPGSKMPHDGIPDPGPKSATGPASVAVVPPLEVIPGPIMLGRLPVSVSAGHLALVTAGPHLRPRAGLEPEYRRRFRRFGSRQRGAAACVGGVGGPHHHR